MPYTGGTFSRAANTTATAGQSITAAMHEAEWEDLKTALNAVPVLAAANTFTVSPQRVTVTDAGAAESALQIILYRNSASPAANDVTGRLSFTGNDSAGNETIYGAIAAVISDTTNTSEDGILGFQTPVAGTIAFRFGIQSGFFFTAGADLGTGTGNFTHIGIQDGVTAPTATTGVAKIYVDSGTGDLSVIFADGTIKTIVTDT